MSLLDEWTPVLDGVEIPENPFDPISAPGKQLVASKGDATPIRWMHRDERYGEKLATPDITIADLIGEVDPIKVAEGRYLSDELTIHYGLLPRVNRGIFAVNELPDLAERIQVGLLNVLEERDIQIRGHRVRLPLDVFLVATANPEDYTNRGRIITPLKDRYGAQIRTHYPEDLHQEIEIMEQEALHLDMGDYRVNVPEFMKEIDCRDHASRAAIARCESAFRRFGARKRCQLRSAAGERVPSRVARGRNGSGAARFRSAVHRSIAARQGGIRSDGRRSGSPHHGPADSGRGEVGVRPQVRHRRRRRDSPPCSTTVYRWKSAKASRRATTATSSRKSTVWPKSIGALAGESEAARAAAIEFVLEGLHLHKLLNKYSVDGRASYMG